MFILSQIALHQSNACDHANITSYSIAIGVLLYAAIYLYVLFYQSQFSSAFNNILIYIVGFDLLLCAFYKFSCNDSSTKASNIESEPFLIESQDILSDEDNGVEGDIESEASQDVGEEANCEQNEMIDLALQSLLTEENTTFTCNVPIPDATTLHESKPEEEPLIEPIPETGEPEEAHIVKPKRKRPSRAKVATPTNPSKNIE